MVTIITRKYAVNNDFTPNYSKPIVKEYKCKDGINATMREIREYDYYNNDLSKYTPNEIIDVVEI